jgi:hypothetical protein
MSFCRDLGFFCPIESSIQTIPSLQWDSSEFVAGELRFGRPGGGTRGDAGMDREFGSLILATSLSVAK